MRCKMMFGAVVTVLLHGCVTNPADCDPSVDKGFRHTAACKLSTEEGGYEGREEALEKQIIAERRLNGSLRDMLVSIDKEKAAVAGERTDQEAKLATLNRSWSSLKTSLEAKAQTSADLRGRIDTLQKKMDAVNAAQSMSPAEKQRRLNSLRSQVKMLMSEMENEFY